MSLRYNCPRAVWLAVGLLLPSAAWAQALPDLKVDRIDVPSSVRPGERFEFGCRVENDSDVDAGSSRVSYNAVYQTTGGGIDIVQLGDDSSGSLRAGRKRTTDRNVDFPDDALPGGVARLTCVADHDDDVREADEDNNGLAQEVTVEAPPPADLSARVSVNRNTVRAGQNVNVECRVDNEGGTESPSGVQVKAIFSGGGAGAPIGTVTVGSIRPDRSRTAEFDAVVPDWVVPGGEVDVVCLVEYDDPDTSNNTDRETLDVEEAADPASVEVTTSVSPTSASVGETVAVACTVTNGGGTPTDGSFSLEASLVSTGGENVAPLGRRTISSLGAGQSRTETISGPVPGWAPSGGVIQAGCVIDYRDDDLTDNVDRVDLQINASETPADIAVEVTSVTPSPASVGGTLSVTCSVTNEGQSATVGAATYGVSLTSVGGENSQFFGSRADPFAPNQTRTETFSGPVPEWAAAGETIIVGCSSTYDDDNLSNNVDSVDLLIENGDPPSAPSPQSPGATTGPPGAEITTLTPTLSWTSVEGAETYGVYVSVSPFGEDNVVYELEGIAATSQTIPSGELVEGASYRWNTRAFNSNGASPFSSRLYFATGAAQAPADLRVTASVSPEGAAVGSEVTVSCSVENAGDETVASGVEVVALFSSGEEGGESSPVGSGTQSLGALAGGASQELTFEGSVPPWAPPGGQIDAVCVVNYTDASPTNNFSRVELQIVGEPSGDVDPAVASVSATPSALDPGGTTAFAVVLENRGTSSLDALRVEVYLTSAGQLPSSDSAPLAVYTSGPIPVGEQRSGTLTLTVPAQTSEGSYSLWAWVDPDNETGQANGDRGNDTASAPITVTSAPEAPDVFVQAVEFNQGAQDRLLPRNSPVQTPRSGAVPFIPGRQTVVRYYLLATGSPVANFTATLQVSNESGSVVDVEPVSSGRFVDVRLDPGPGGNGRSEAVLDQRRRVWQSLDFIVDAFVTDEANTVHFDLVAGGERLTRNSFSNIQDNRVELLLNVLRVVNSDLNGCGNGQDCENGGVPLAQVRRDVFDHPEATLPFVGRPLFSLRDYEFDWSYWRRLLIGTDVPPCSALLSQMNDLSPSAGGVLQPSRPGGAYHLVNLAVISERWGDRWDIAEGKIVNEGDGWDCAGVAYLSSAAAVSRPRGETVGHEIGHTLGIPHVSSTPQRLSDGSYRGEHGERGVDPSESRYNPWRFPHGLIGDGMSEFGAYVVGSGASRRVEVIDPCPGKSYAERLGGCPLGDENDSPARHELMSYGYTDIPFEGRLSREGVANRWLSPLLFVEMHNNAIAGVGRSASLARTSSPSVEALSVSAIVPEGGRGAVMPVLPENVAASEITPPTGGSEFLMTVYDSDNRVVSTLLLDSSPVEDSTGTVHFLNALLPATIDVSRVVVSLDGSVVAESVARPSRPSVRLISPVGGETYSASDSLAVIWSASDPDGDVVGVFVELTTDAGQTWTTVGSRSAESGGLQLAANLFDVGTQNQIRLTASDGTSTAQDVTNGYFAVVGEPTTQDPDREPPATFLLGAPSPNPTRGAVEVPITLPTAAPVRLTVYDTLGREVLAGFSGNLPTGTTRVRLDTNALSPGIYLIVARVDGEIIPGPVRISVTR